MKTFLDKISFNQTFFDQKFISYIFVAKVLCKKKI